MASGKTRIGRRVARLIGAEFIDTDARIVAEHGPIAEIFERDGEEAFRAMERAAVVEALRQQAVVSLGGGAVLHPDTREDLRRYTVVYLTVSPEAVAHRLAAGSRPLVATGGVEAWRRIFEERRSIYEELATVTYDTSRRPIMTIAKNIAHWWKATQ